VSGWIKWEKDLEGDPRFVRLVRHVRNACVTDASQGGYVVTLTVGALLRFWSYADTHIRSDDTLDLSPEDIDDLVGLPKFTSGMPDDWLVVLDDGRVELPGYQGHNGVEAKKRDLAAKRMERKRLRDSHARVTTQRNGGVTGASPDQTRPDHKEKISAEPPALAPPVVLKDGSDYTPPPELIDSWKAAYPHIVVLEQLHRIAAWNRANRAKRKTRRGVESHIVGWLAKADAEAAAAQKAAAEAEAGAPKYGPNSPWHASRMV